MLLVLGHSQSTACYSDMLLWVLHKTTAEEASADGFTTVHALKDRLIRLLHASD